MAKCFSGQSDIIFSKYDNFDILRNFVNTYLSCYEKFKVYFETYPSSTSRACRKQ